MLCVIGAYPDKQTTGDIMSNPASLTTGEGFSLKINHDDHGQPSTGVLYLRHRADDQFIKELTACEEIIGDPRETDNLRFEIACNSAASVKEVQIAVSTCVSRFNTRRGFVHATYDPRWRMVDSNQYGTDFFLSIFPLTQEVVDELRANPAIARAHVYDANKGFVHVELRQPFKRDEVRGDIKRILRTFVGKELPYPSKKKTKKS